jgi:hypothetical protein
MQSLLPQDDEERDVLREIISNSKLSEHFLALARDLDVMEPKVPEDVYKTHLTGQWRCTLTVRLPHYDSLRLPLAGIM